MINIKKLLLASFIMGLLGIGIGIIIFFKMPVKYSANVIMMEHNDVNLINQYKSFVNTNSFRSTLSSTKGVNQFNNVQISHHENSSLFRIKVESTDKSIAIKTAQDYSKSLIISVPKFFPDGSVSTVSTTQVSSNRDSFSLIKDALLFGVVGFLCGALIVTICFLFLGNADTKWQVELFGNKILGIVKV